MRHRVGCKECVEAEPEGDIHSSGGILKKGGDCTEVIDQYQYSDHYSSTVPIILG
jgi:hypothetical protein